MSHQLKSSSWVVATLYILTNMMLNYENFYELICMKPDLMPLDEMDFWYKSLSLLAQVIEKMQHVNEAPQDPS